MSRTEPATTSPPLDFVPRSLRSGHRMQYELRDAANRRVPPTLAGYRLRANRQYALVVHGDAGAEEPALEVHPLQSPRLVHWEHPVPESVRRVRVPFATRGRAAGGLQLLDPPTADLRLSVRRGDGGATEDLRIPISVHGRWWYALMLIPAGVVTWLAGRVLPFWLSAVVAAGVLAVLVGGLALIDRWRMWRRARELLAAYTEAGRSRSRDAGPTA